MKNAVGILGGTFDPIHNGHIKLASTLYANLPLQEIRFIPSAQSPLKAHAVASATQRLAMVKLAIQKHNGFIVDDREIRHGSYSYTVETLSELRKESGDTPLCFMLSMDQFLQFDRWHDWQRILTWAHLIVANRPGYLAELNATLKILLAAKQIHTPEQLVQTPAGNILFYEFNALNISSTEIRAKIARQESVIEWVPEAVWEYIVAQKLYSRLGCAFQPNRL